MNSFQLKIVALVTMIIDHIGHRFAAFADLGFLRIIGRIAFPIYVFCIAEGCRHTRSMEKYLLRLGVFALISEVPFDLFISNRIFYSRHQNVFFTLFLGVACVWIYERLKARIFPAFAFVLGLLPVIAAYYLHTDYGAPGVLAVYLCYMMPVRPLQVLTVLALMFFEYRISAFFGASLVAIALICVYNGKRGYPLRLAFYAIYPIHLLILYGAYKIVAFWWLA